MCRSTSTSLSRPTRISPTRIAATGGSYGGSESLLFAVLKNRMMMLDNSLVPWTSPDGTPMSTAVALPDIAWSDLIQSLAPNGDTLDYLRDGSFSGVGGVLNESYVNQLYVTALNAPPGQDPRADPQGWMALLAAGEPYTGAAHGAMFDEITNFHYFGMSFARPKKRGEKCRPGGPFLLHLRVNPSAGRSPADRNRPAHASGDTGSFRHGSGYRNKSGVLSL